MTLVEVIIGLSIFSVALIILSTGFITGGRVLADANEHSIQSNQMKIELADQKGLLEDASVTIEVNHKDIVLKGNYQVVSGEDEHLDFQGTALEVDRKVRALNPEPYANMLLNKEEVKVIEGYIGEDTNTKAGTIANITKDAIGIACKDKIYYITKLKPFGKKEMMTRDYLNGTDKNKLKMSIVE